MPTTGAQRKSFTKDLPYQHIMQRAHPGKRTGRLECSADSQLADGVGLKACNIRAFKQNFSGAGP